MGATTAKPRARGEKNACLIQEKQVVVAAAVFGEQQGHTVPGSGVVQHFLRTTSTRCQGMRLLGQKAAARGFDVLKRSPSYIKVTANRPLRFLPLKSGCAGECEAGNREREHNPDKGL